MLLDNISMNRKARELGFVRDTFEKVCRLAEILDFIQKSYNINILNLALVHIFWIIVLTFIRSLIFNNLPWLSVDIDFDFAENISREEMLAVRAQITDRIGKKWLPLGIALVRDPKRIMRLTHLFMST